MTVWPQIAYPSQLHVGALVCFHVDFHLGINPGPIPVYHVVSISFQLLKCLIFYAYEHVLLINIYRQECRLCERIVTLSLPKTLRRPTRKLSKRTTKNMTSTSSQSAIYALTLPILLLHCLTIYNYNNTETSTPDCIN